MDTVMGFIFGFHLSWSSPSLTLHAPTVSLLHVQALSHPTPRRLPHPICSILLHVLILCYHFDSVTLFFPTPGCWCCAPPFSWEPVPLATSIPSDFSIQICQPKGIIHALVCACLHSCACVPGTFPILGLNTKIIQVPGLSPGLSLPSGN